jgi:hypothetical protein
MAAALDLAVDPGSAAEKVRPRAPHPPPGPDPPRKTRPGHRERAVAEAAGTGAASGTPGNRAPDPGREEHRLPPQAASAAARPAGRPRPPRLPEPPPAARTPAASAPPPPRRPGARRLIPAQKSLIIAGTKERNVNMAEQAPPWPKQGPASFFPSIEKKYGRSIAERSGSRSSGLRPRQAHGYRGLPEVRAWHGARARQRTRRLDAHRQRRLSLKLRGLEDAVV